MDILTMLSIILFVRTMITGVYFDRRLKEVHQINMQRINDCTFKNGSWPELHEVEMSEWWPSLFNLKKWTYKQYFKFIK